MGAIQFTVEIESETCCNCGIPFGISADVKRRLMERGGDFYCTNGHCQHYTKTEVARLREQLAKSEAEKERQRIARLSAEASALELGSKLNRLKKRVANGVCPCCKRSFSKLHQHMKTKHPEYAVAVEKKP